jgi:hypothetical protein
MRKKTNATRAFRPLAQGQQWKTKDAYIEIIDLGKRLIHYRLVRQLGQMRRTQTSGIDTMEAYLKANAAKLVKGASAN